MSLAKILLLVGLACCTGSSMPGGWTEQAPESNPEYLKLAHFAVSQQTSGRRYYDTVLELLRVETQVVAGINYRLTFKTAVTDCQIGVDDYSEEKCQPKTNEADGVCTATVYVVPWKGTQNVVSYTCQQP